MFHYFYRITNKLNGKIYCGIHSTENINDNYLGSGVGIRRAISKFGKDNFIKEILRFFDTREEAALYEQQIVDQEFIDRKDTYNQITGGERYQILGSKLSTEARRKISESKTGVKRSEEVNRKNSEARQRERWVHNGLGKKQKVRVEDLENWLSCGWKRGMGSCRTDEFKEKARQAHLGIKLTADHREAIRKANTGRVYGTEHNERIANYRRGKVFVNKDGTCKVVDALDLTRYLEEGWIRGRGKQNRYS